MPDTSAPPALPLPSAAKRLAALRERVRPRGTKSGQQPTERRAGLGRRQNVAANYAIEEQPDGEATAQRGQFLTSRWKADPHITR